MSSSVVFVAAVAFWLLGVAPALLKRRVRARAVASEAVEPESGTQVFAAMDPVRTEEAVSKEDETVPMDDAMPLDGTAPRRDAAPGEDAAQPESVPRPSLPAARKPRVRADRAAVALVGAAALLAAPVTLILAVFSIVSFGAPVICLAVTALCVATLRRLAQRDRMRRVERAFQDAMAPVATEDRRAVVPARPLNSPSQPFDRVEDAPAEPTTAPAQPPLTAAELREAALAVAREIGDSLPAEDSSWEPVEVPKPLYVDAPKAERPSPEPLNLPAAPRPEGKPIIKDALKPDPAEAVQAGDPTVKVVVTGQPALKNLDAILQRRRA